MGAIWSDVNGHDSGSAYLLYGRSKADFRKDRASLALSLDVLEGIAASDNLGNSVSHAGDFNNDGFDDFIVGAPLASPNDSTNAGKSFLIFGDSSFSAPDLSALDGTNGLVLHGETAGEQSGYAVSSVGDVNNDGIDDIVIGAPFGGRNGEGKAYVVFGSNQPLPGTIELANLDGSNGFVINGGAAGDALGISVSQAGDLNADGVDDIIIGAKTADANGVDSGATYLIYGSPKTFPATIDVATLDQSEGFVLQGVNGGDQFGTSVGSIGDFNGDNIADVIIGSSEADSNGTSSGQANVVFGELVLPIDPETGSEYRPNLLIVEFENDVTEAEIQAIASASGATSVETAIPSGSSRLFKALSQWRTLEFAPGTNLVPIKNDLANNNRLKHSLFDYVLSANGLPNDTSFNDLWGLHNIGQGGGTVDADIDAPEAWCKQHGDRDIVVAVLDTGVDYTHSDLAPNIWTNLGEIPGNGVDDDHNNYTDDVQGYDFHNNDGDPDDDSSDGHGTHVAGTIGAVGNNNLGVIGVSPEVSLMALKVLDANGDGFTTNAIEAIRYAVDNGANIINASFSHPPGTPPNPLFDVVLGIANSNNVLFVASAGSDTNNNDVTPIYPANYNRPNVISVAATDRDDNLAAFSNFGATTVDLGAPGVSIYSTLPGNAYGFMDGASMAAPHVSGAAALLLAENPSLTPTQIIQVLTGTVDPVPGLNGFTATGGRLNIDQALTSIGAVNNPPVLTNTIRGQQLVVTSIGGGISEFTFAPNTFVDPDPGDTITYTAELLTGVTGWTQRFVGGDWDPVVTGWSSATIIDNDVDNPPVVGLSFDPATRTFQTHTNDQQFHWVRVTATDGCDEDVTYFDFFNWDGVVIDNYIVNTTVFLDLDGNGQHDADEPFGISDENGGFNFGGFSILDHDANLNGSLDPDEASIVAIGGIDTATGLSLETPLRATPEATVVSLLTSLVAELVDQGFTIEEANAFVLNAFSIPADIEINTFDPIEATRNNEAGGVETFAAMVQVQNTITQIAGLLGGASSASQAELVNAVVRAIASAIQLVTPLDLTDPAQLQTIIESAAAGIGINVDDLSAQAAEVVTAANEKIEDAVANSATEDLEEAFAKVQKVALGETTQDLKAAGAGTKSIGEVVAENTGTELDDQIVAAQVFSADPTDISLSNDTVAEDQPIGTEVGTFSTVDPDTGEAHTYSLVAGAGDTDNNKFEIVGDRLIAKESFDYDAQDSYSIRVLASDGNGGIYSEPFTVEVAPLPKIAIQTLVDANGDGVFNETETGSAGESVKFQLTITNNGDTDAEIEAIANDILDLDSAFRGNFVGQTIAAGDSITATFMTTLPDLVSTTVGTADGDTLNGEQMLVSGEMSVTAANAAGSTTVTETHEVLVDARDTIAGDLGEDVIFGSGADDILRGDLNQRDSQVGIGHDDIIHGGAGNDRIGGKGGNDQLFGDEGDDQIWGDDGDDLLRGGLGNDTLTGDDSSGGQGSDTFVLAIGEGTDTITDFEVGTDLIGLADGLSFGQLDIAQVGNDAQIAVGNEILAVLQGTDASELLAPSFQVV